MKNRNSIGHGNHLNLEQYVFLMLLLTFLDYGGNGGEVGFFIMFGDQKRPGVLYRSLNKINRGCAH